MNNMNTLEPIRLRFAAVSFENFRSSLIKTKCFISISEFRDMGRYRDGEQIEI